MELDDSLSKNAQNIHSSHRIYQENHGNLEIGIDSRRKNLSYGKNIDSYIPGRCAITIIIC